MERAKRIENINNVNIMLKNSQTQAIKKMEREPKKEDTPQRNEFKTAPVERKKAHKLKLDEIFF